jgi:hypothetical protein
MAMRAGGRNKMWHIGQRDNVVCQGAATEGLVGMPSCRQLDESSCWDIT